MRLPSASLHEENVTLGYTDATFSYIDATFGYIDSTFGYIDVTFSAMWNKNPRVCSITISCNDFKSKHRYFKEAWWTGIQK
uniref:Uncharacterized protein n=1 Tax=Acrobeloides nanus TaxID=290746 RepID=A0A914DWE3_9BILA